MLPIHTILHPTDFSQQSGYAFQLACALARDHGARLLLAHVLQLPPVTIVGEFVAAPLELGESRDEAQAQLECLEPAGAPIPIEHCLLEGDPATKIVELARERACSLIVMGTHGRTGLARLLMGSVAEHVVRAASCPVLTAKAPLPELATVPAMAPEPVLAQ